MKAVIWVVCAFVITLANEFLGAALGFKVGYVILFLLIGAASKALCAYLEGREPKKVDGPAAPEKPAQEQIPAPAAPENPAQEEVKTSTQPQPEPPQPEPQPPAEEAAPEAEPPKKLPVITDRDRRMLKTRAIAWLPGDLFRVESQRKLVTMLGESIPPVQVCAAQAERQLWLAVERGQMPLNQAMLQCACTVDRMLSITRVENLKLEEKDPQTLLRGWVVLDYYAGILPESHSAHIRSLRDRMTAILITE